MTLFKVYYVSSRMICIQISLISDHNIGNPKGITTVEMLNSLWISKMEHCLKLLSVFPKLRN